MALNAIFFENNKLVKICENNADKYLPYLKEYISIFSLNYINIWDAENQCIYLHGVFPLDDFRDKTYSKPVLLYDLDLYKSYDKYHFYINELSYDNCICPISNTRSIIFSPSFLRKQEAVNLGLYGGDNLFPSNYLFPANPIILYEKLNKITHIDVFGVSPHGDCDLVEKLKNINSGTIFCYTKKDLEEWKERLGESSFTYMDASDFGI